MSTRAKLFTVLFSILFPLAALAQAQFPIIGADDVKSHLKGKRAVLIDTRNSEEYRSGHIPGAVNIPAEQIKPEAGRLPKNKSVPIIFYCRGAG